VGSGIIGLRRSNIAHHRRSWPASPSKNSSSQQTSLHPIFEADAKEAELAPSTVKRWSPVVDA
jgi:hypothetical protein